MGTASLHFDNRGLVWRDLWRRLSGYVPEDCIHLRSFWRRARLAPYAVRIDGNRYCADKCLDGALITALGRARLDSPRPGSVHRIPLGVLLLSRQQLSAEQLQAALEAQRSAGHGRLGEWLQRLGYASEQQITAALARQWSCPMLHPDFSFSCAREIPKIPLTLLRTYSMTAVDYVRATATLHIAFAESIDYTALFAISKCSPATPNLAWLFQNLCNRNCKRLPNVATTPNSYSTRPAASLKRPELFEAIANAFLRRKSG